MTKSVNPFRAGIIYRGPSQLDGAPIVVVAIYTKSNAKTGQVLQTYILADNGVDPVANARTLADASICGACPHRRGLGGACYVTLHQGPLVVFKGLQRGIYAPKQDPASLVDMGRGRFVRLGTYGDPAAVPYAVWATLTHKATGHAGYTHQSRHPSFDKQLLDLCMVSVDTEKQASLQRKKDPTARWFRVMGANDALMPDEIECKAESEGLSCVDCGLCYGRGHDLNIAIRVHGALSGRYESKLGKIATTAV